MPKPQPRPNRHHFRIWIKMAIQSGLIDKLPPFYEPDGLRVPSRTEDYARQLLAELRDPEASGRPLKDIIADARLFKTWVESRRKDNRKRSLVESRPGDRVIEISPLRLSSEPPDERKPRRPDRPSQPDSNPKLHPMWDDWIDCLER